MIAGEGVSPSTPPTGGSGASRYLVLSGAKINAGDFLIRRRILDLISSVKPSPRVRVHDRWRPLDEGMVEWADAVLLCGGPALQPHLYPGIYPLLPSLDRVEAPIIGIGLGWKGTPGDRWSERTYHFTEDSRRLLRRMEDDGWAMSCRDPATERVLNACGFERTTMTGDPAWFDLERIGASFEIPDRLEVLMLSMPASPIYFDQSIRLLRALQESGSFRRILGAFNHGWKAGEHVAADRAAGLRRLRRAVTDLGVEALDLSGGLEPMLEAASRCDIHIGYRLHAHLLFLSRRRPSILLEEDGRGRAAGEALGFPGITAWKRPRGLLWLLSALRVAGGPTLPVQRLVQGLVRADESAVSNLLAALDRHRSGGFSDFADVGQRIDDIYHVAMRPFLRSLP